MIENLQPLKNKGGVIRRIFDLQIASTYKGIVPYLKSVDTGDKIYFLEVGCGNQPYMNLVPTKAVYTGIEWDGAGENFKYDNRAVLHYDGENFPVENVSQDVVFHTEVIEHVFDTEHFLEECNRVLKPDGKMLFTVPFQARFHYIPYDYWRFTPSSLMKLLEKAGFKNIEIHERGTDIGVAAYKVLTIGYRLFFSRKLLKMFVSVLFAPIWIVALLIGQMDVHLHLGSKDDSMGYIVYCQKKSKVANPKVL